MERWGRPARRKKRKKALLAGALAVAVAACGSLYFLSEWIHHKSWFSGEDFGIERITSPMDYNGNGTDDYTDILLGARADAENRPRYDGSYYAGGYPPEDIGVCTDVVWRGFRQAGYSLKDMVNEDIRRRPEAYPQISTPDPNIDFRRVSTLMVFFSTYGEELTTDRQQIDQWQPGDIIFFNGEEHVGIVSDRRNEEGQPYIIHNGGQWRREEDYLRYSSQQVSAHFRFNGAAVGEEMLRPWKDGEEE